MKRRQAHSFSCPLGISHIFVPVVSFEIGWGRKTPIAQWYRLCAPGFALFWLSAVLSCHGKKTWSFSECWNFWVGNSFLCPIINLSITPYNISTPLDLGLWISEVKNWFFYFYLLSDVSTLSWVNNKQNAIGTAQKENAHIDWSTKIFFPASDMFDICMYSVWIYH